MALTVVLLGAESTGKTTLANELGSVLSAEGRKVAVVHEYLREFCEGAGRTPRPDEQAAIAAEQTRRITAAAPGRDVVVADTAALMVAVYSELLFADTSLYPDALDALRGPLVLVTAVDLPWVFDGLFRDGPHVQEPVNRLVRQALVRGGIDHAVVSGQGPQRLASALVAVRHALAEPDAERERRVNPRWQWSCERCSDGECERHIRLPR